MPHFFLVAGEASGDMHAARLIHSLKKINPDSRFTAFGGEKMKAAGAEIIFEYKTIAFMGFKEVFLNLITIIKAIHFCKSSIIQTKPDAVILIDYPGFNLKIAAFAKSIGVKVIYYIAPQVWAWKEKRVSQIKKNVDHLICILPFEKEFYIKHHYQAHYFGHPLVEAVKEHQTDQHFLEKYKNKKVIAVLPGSRKQEIRRMLRIMINVAHNFPEYLFILAIAANLDKNLFENLSLPANIEKVYGKTYDVMSVATAGIIKSGTSTLEAALFNLPQVVCYKTSVITYRLARFFAKVSFISLVNIIANRKIVCELIQNEMNENSIGIELNKILTDENYRHSILDGYAEVIQIIGASNTSRHAAESISKFLKT